MVRYYSIHRPVAPGTFPRTAAVECIHNFDRMQYVKEIGRDAWGYIEYASVISEKDARAYELVKA